MRVTVEFCGWLPPAAVRAMLVLPVTVPATNSATQSAGSRVD